MRIFDSSGSLDELATIRQLEKKSAKAPEEVIKKQKINKQSEKPAEFSGLFADKKEAKQDLSKEVDLDKITSKTIRKEKEVKIINSTREGYLTTIEYYKNKLTPIDFYYRMINSGRLIGETDKDAGIVYFHKSQIMPNGKLFPYINYLREVCKNEMIIIDFLTKCPEALAAAQESFQREKIVSLFKEFVKCQK